MYVCVCVYVCRYVCTCVCTFDLRTYVCKSIQWPSRCSSKTDGQTTVGSTVMTNLVVYIFVMPVHWNQCVFWCVCGPSVKFCTKYPAIRSLKINRSLRLYYLVLAVVRSQNQLSPHGVIRSSVCTGSMSPVQHITYLILQQLQHWCSFRTEVSNSVTHLEVCFRNFYSNFPDFNS